MLVNSDGGEENVTILDVSSGGFRITGSEAVRAGELVHVRVERGETLAAQIRWVLGNEAGGVFLTSPGAATVA